MVQVLSVSDTRSVTYFQRVLRLQLMHAVTSNLLVDRRWFSMQAHPVSAVTTTSFETDTATPCHLRPVSALRLPQL